MGARHAARRLGVQALYALDLNRETTPRDAIDRAVEDAANAPMDNTYLDRVVFGVWQQRARVDGEIQQASQRWKLSRMDRVDLSVLRLAVYELLFEGDTPAQVILNEGVELAKEFGTPDSPSFVNGILDRIAHQLRKGDLGTA